MCRVVCCLFMMNLMTVFANAQSCSVPPVPPSCEAPSCVAPSCVAPSCVAPAQIFEGCDSERCSRNAACNCSKSCYSGCRDCASGLCRKPLINIDLSRTVNKTVTKKNSRWDALAEAPPTTGFVAYSVPVLQTNVTAVPFSFGAATSASSNLDRETLQLLLDELRERKANAAAAATVAGDKQCPDPCGQIKQLEDDMKQLSLITRNLSLAVQKLAEEHANE
jgi:hypothetical protein